MRITAVIRVRRFVRVSTFFSAFMAVLLAAGTAHGQISSQTGAVRGIVLDPSGAAVASANLTLTSSIGAATTKQTGQDGNFVFPLLDPGEYRLTAEAAGFRRAVYEKVLVRITEVTPLEIKLEVGELVSEVVVTAEETQVNINNATVGAVLAGSVIENMPLSTRNFTGLLALNAGTSSALPNAATAGRGSSTVFVNGMRGTFNNLVINGVDANNLGNNNFGNVAIPSPDTIDEFRVQTSLYDASQGKTSGGNVNVRIKGGSSEYHGELYEFFRNEVLNANEFFLNRGGTDRPILRQNQFGGNFGGPVPKLQDRIFFFGSYQGTRQLNGASGAITSQWPVLPATRDQASIESNFGLAPGSLHPVALAILQHPGIYDGFLVPSGSGAAPGQLGNVSISEPLQFNDNQFNSNADLLLSNDHKVLLRYFWASGETSDPIGGQGAGSFGSGETNPVRNHLAVVSHTWTINPNLLNEARIGFNRIIGGRVAPDPASVSGVGMNRFNSSVFDGLPLLFTFDLDPAFGGITTNADQASVNNTYTVGNTLAYTRGSHSFRGGFEYRRYQINLFNNFASRGFLAFNTFTDFLQGSILWSFVGTGQTDRGFRARDVSVFFQDDWKIHRRLTLNLGVRWDYLGPSVDVRDRLGNFDPSRLDSVTRANAGPGLLNGFILPESANFGAIQGTPGVDRSTLLNNDHNNYAPRVGLAWDVFGDGKTSVRSGYGLYYVRISNQMLLQLITSAPFFQLSSLLPAPSTLTLSDPFPSGLPIPADFPIFPTPPSFTGFTGAGTPTFAGNLLSLNPFERGIRTPYAQHWNLMVQRDLPWSFNLEVGYLGTSGVKLLHSRQMNQARLANAANPIVVGGAGSVPVTTITENASRNINARVGVLGFSATGLNTVTGNGHSSYNALVLTVNRRTARMFVQGAYTFSKSIDNNSGSFTQDLGGSGGNQLDTRLVRALSNFDRTHRLQVTYRYAIPGFETGALEHVLGNWEIGGLTTIQSGLPQFVSCPACAGNLYGISTGSLFPDVAGSFANLRNGSDPRNFTSTSIYNTTGILQAPPALPLGSNFGPLNTFGGQGNQTFTIGGPGTGSRSGAIIGNLGRNPAAFRAPYQQQWDFYVGKNIPLQERLALQFRAEFFNLFNYASFAGPNTAFGSSAFGIYDSTVGSPRIVQFALKLKF
ncbi:MAG: TonB-dependent receptor [Acidobacteria bacterium]|nr:TonB-dependent receptor [Acidobacteriota bacterium]